MIFKITPEWFLVIWFYCSEVKRRKANVSQLKQLDLAFWKHFLNRLSVNSTVKCEWGPKIVQHNFILIFKYYANLCFKQYMITQKDFITYHFLCSGWNRIIGAMYYLLLMLNLLAMSRFLWFSHVRWICLSLGVLMPQLGGTVSLGPSPHVGCQMLIHSQRSRNWATTVPSWAMWCTGGGRVCPKRLRGYTAVQCR